MSKCAVVADKDPCLAAVTAHLLTAVFDTEVFRSQIRKSIEFYTTETPCFNSALAVEIVGSTIGNFQSPVELDHENVAVLVTASGIAANDQMAHQLLKQDVPLLQLGEFHPSKINFVNFDEEIAGHSFAIALAEASVGVSNFLLNFLAPSQ